MAAYLLAVEQGADVIEPDLVPSRDGVLYAHHDAFLSLTSDIATRPEWGLRARGGEWWVDELNAAELDRLRLMQRWPQRDHAHDHRHAMLRFADMLDWILALNRTGNHSLKVYPEIKQPAYFRARGQDPLALLASILEARSAMGVESCVWLQCLDHAVLREAHAMCGNRCYALLEAPGLRNWHPRLAELAGWAHGIAPDKSLLWDARGHDTGLVRAAHDAGLEVHAWTFRDDVDASPFGRPTDALRMALSLGVDALFCDFPDTAIRLRHTMGMV